MQRIWNFILPNRCVLTGKIVQDSFGLSSEGFSSLTFITGVYCTACAAPLQYQNESCHQCVDERFSFDHARSVLVYNHQSKPLILKFKHGDRLNLSPVFGRWLATYGQDVIDDADLLMPVPLHPKRLRQRQYNQAAELVKSTSKLSGKPYVLDALIRVRHTKPQGHEDREARFENLKDAFVVNPKYHDKLKDNHIVIVDDVMTTGATLDECAKALKQCLPRKISVLTLSKVLL